MPSVPTPRELDPPEPLPMPRLLLLHLLPGALATAFFVVVAPAVEAAGFPPLLAFLLAILVVIVPFELGVVLLVGRREAPAGGWLAAIPYRQPMPARDWLVLVPVLTLVAILGFGLLAALEPTVRDSLFGWLPTWFTELVPIDAVGDFSSTAWYVTLALYAALNVVLGPIVEELYFRGYLLPRMTPLGRWAPLVNVVLFSVYHFWAPWGLLSRIAGVTPFAYAVWWKRNVALGMAVHVLLNAIGTLTLIALVLQELG